LTDILKRFVVPSITKLAFIVGDGMFATLALRIERFYVSGNMGKKPRNFKVTYNKRRFL